MKHLILLSLTIASALWLCVAVEIKNTQAEYTIAAVVEDPLTIFAHKYHGINSSVKNHFTGKQYFYRNGKKCSLITNAVLQKYSERSK